MTHDGEELPCWPMAYLSSVRQKLGPEAYNKVWPIEINSVGKK